MVFEASEPGPSAGDDRARSAADPARDLARAAEALGLDRYRLLATSSDGALALRLAAEHPDRIEALVLESPPALAWPGDAAGAGPATTGGAPPPDAAGARPGSAGTVPPRGADGRDADLAARLAGLAVPVLALFGTRDRTIPREAARRYREHLPHCHVMLVYDAGHAIAADRPEAVASLVADFLERREQFVVSRAGGLLHR
jgi:pimeloyl-ACP methyl ester carboxylesterase